MGDAITFFVGSGLFTTGGALQTWLAAPDRSSAGAGRAACWTACWTASVALLGGGTDYVQPADYWIITSASTWGWIMLIAGLALLAAGFGVTSGAAWARWLDIVPVSLQASINLVFIPVQPWWAITLIVFDLWIIHSLFVHRRERLWSFRDTA